MAGRSGRGKGATFAALLAEYERRADRAKWLHGYDRARLLRVFGRLKLAAITSERITRYGLAREAAGAAPEIVNHELKTLADILKLARVSGWIAAEPTIWFMREERKEQVHRLSLPLALRTPGLFSRGAQWQIAAPDTKPPERPPKRGKLSREALAEHLASYPKGHRKPDGSALKISERVRLLESKGISIHRSTLSKRLARQTE